MPAQGRDDIALDPAASFWCFFPNKMSPKPQGFSSGRWELCLTHRCDIILGQAGMVCREMQLLTLHQTLSSLQPPRAAQNDHEFGHFKTVTHTEQR